MCFGALLSAGLLLSSCGRDSSSPAGASSTPLGDAAYAHTENILAYGPRPPESKALGQVRSYLIEQLGKQGWTCDEQSFKANTPKGPMTFTNLIARYGKAEEADLFTRPVEGLLCCHIDSKAINGIRFLGADDAASAAGAIIEIARVLHEQDPEMAAKLEIIFFDGEEAIGRNIDMQRGDGLYGSRSYAKKWSERGPLPKFGILLDMIGHKDLRIKLPADYNPPELAAALIAAGKAEGRPNAIVQGNSGIIDDHIPLNLAGIPTVDMIGDFTRSTWWHTSRDDISIISADSLDFSTRVVLRFLRERL